MINKFFEVWCYTKSFGLMVKLPISFFLNRLGMFFNSRFLKNMATNFVCKKPYILRTPFGNYLAISLFHYACLYKDYELKIGDIIGDISKKVDLSDSYLINIGANIGRWSIGLAKEYGYKVMAFEPGPSTFKNLKINTVLSDLDSQIEIYNIGLGNTNELMQFGMEYECDSEGHIITGTMTDSKCKIIDVPVRKFDDLQIDKEKIDKTRLIIMDVEGFEFNVIKGMEKSLKMFHDINIIMEIREHRENKNDTIKFMENLGYKRKKIDDDNRFINKHFFIFNNIVIRYYFIK